MILILLEKFVSRKKYWVEPDEEDKDYLERMTNHPKKSYATTGLALFYKRLSALEPLEQKNKGKKVNGIKVLDGMASLNQIGCHMDFYKKKMYADGKVLYAKDDHFKEAFGCWMTEFVTTDKHLIFEEAAPAPAPVPAPVPVPGPSRNNKDSVRKACRNKLLAKIKTNADPAVQAVVTALSLPLHDMIKEIAKHSISIADAGTKHLVEAYVNLEKLLSKKPFVPINFEKAKDYFNSLLSP